MEFDEREKLMALNLEEKINQSKKIIKEAIEKFGTEKLAIAWTGGKDSTTMTWLFRETCRDLKMPMPRFMFIDEGYVFEEIWDIVHQLKKEWNLNVIIAKNTDVSDKAKNIGDMVKVASLNARNREEIEKLGFDGEEFPFEPESFVGNHLMKTVAMNVFLEENGIEALATAIRWDEQTARIAEAYFSPRSNPPHTIPQDLTAVVEFEIGNIDILTIPASEYSKYRADLKRSQYISSLKGLNTYYIGFNCSRPPFNNLKLRRAIFMSIDREKILDTLYEQRGRLAAGPVPDMFRRWHEPGYPAFDPRRAKLIIEQEGLGSQTLSLYTPAEQEIVDIAEVVQSYIQETGVTVRIKQLEWSAYKEAVNKGEPDMFYLSWWADYPDPENFLFPLFHSSNHGPAGNRTRYTNPQVDSFIEQAETTTDEKKRWQLYRVAEDAIVSDLPWVPLWHKTDFVIRQPWIKNYRMYQIYSMDKGTEIAFQ